MTALLWRSACFVALWSVAGGAPAGEWLTDLDDARRVAAEQNRELLINFTGTEWCAECTKLEQDLLDRPEFDSAAELFVLVKLEFPASDETLPPEVREKYVAWRQKYGVRGFPTVFLADATGRPYAVTGYIDVEPKEYVRHLKQLRQGLPRRDMALDRAAGASGVERAQHLDEALTALRDVFANDYVEVNGDPLVRFYRAEIDQILALDAGNAAGLRDKYQEVLDTQAERARVAEIYKRLDAIQNEQGLPPTVAYMDEEIERAKSTDLRNRLRRSRLVLLEWSDRYDEALAFAEQLAKDESYSAEDRRNIRSRIAFNQWRLGRVDEAVAVYDRLISEVADDSHAAFMLHWSKAEMLTTAKRFEEALATWNSARQYVRPGTSDCVECDVFRARLMLRLDHPHDAVAVYKEVVEMAGMSLLDRAQFLAELATALEQAGNREEALRQADRSERLLAELEEDEADATVYIESVRRKLRAVRVSED